MSAPCWPPCPPLADLQAKQAAHEAALQRLSATVAELDAKRSQGDVDFRAEIRGKLDAIVETIQGLYDFLRPPPNGRDHE